MDVVFMGCGLYISIYNYYNNANCFCLTADCVMSIFQSLLCRIVLNFFTPGPLTCTAEHVRFLILKNQ